MCDPSAGCDASANVPPTAYEHMPLAIQSEDPSLNVGKDELLAALRMPREARFVAEWLFTQTPSQPPLPPEAFDNSLAIHLHHDISASGRCHNPPPPPFRPEATSEPPSNSFTVTKDIDLLIVPVAKVDGLTIGYTFLKGVQDGIPGVTFFSGRFAFEEGKKDFLMIVNGMSSHMTGIVSMRWRDPVSRDRSFFAIPKGDYGPDNLPSRVLSLQCNVDYEELPLPDFDDKWLAEFADGEQDSLEKISSGWMEPQIDDTWPDSLESIGTVIQPDDPGLLPELFQDFSSPIDLDAIISDATTIISNPSSSSNVSLSSSSPLSPPQDGLSLPTLPSDNNWMLSRQPPQDSWMSSPQPAQESWLLSGETPDGVGIPRRPGKNDTSSGAFDMSLLSDSLAQIEKTMNGKFYSPKVRKDVLHPQTGELLSRCTGELRAHLQSVNGIPLTLLRQIAAQTYYASQMPVTPDVRLLKPPSPPLPRVAPLAPRPVPGGSADHMSEEAAREAKLEAKRIKNRMSAAKSNKKRRAQLEAQKKELATLRNRVELLRGKKMRMLEDNESLKRQVQQII